MTTKGQTGELHMQILWRERCSEYVGFIEYNYTKEYIARTPF